MISALLVHPCTTAANLEGLPWRAAWILLSFALRSYIFKKKTVKGVAIETPFTFL